ncbi:hypothetical protein GQ600_8716 [Phytophthora cactorum]|nr:hypothetical protein GQ600_8716 [Phytophthora cactorum]
MAYGGGGWHTSTRSMTSVRHITRWPWPLACAKVTKRVVHHLTRCSTNPLYERAAQVLRKVLKDSCEVPATVARPKAYATCFYLMGVERKPWIWRQGFGGASRGHGLYRPRTLLGMQQGLRATSHDQQRG